MNRTGITPDLDVPRDPWSRHAWFLATALKFGPRSSYSITSNCRPVRGDPGFADLRPGKIVLKGAPAPASAVAMVVLRSAVRKARYGSVVMAFRLSREGEAGTGDLGDSALPGAAKAPGGLPGVAWIVARSGNTEDEVLEACGAVGAFRVQPRGGIRNAMGMTRICTHQRFGALSGVTLGMLS